MGATTVSDAGLILLADDDPLLLKATASVLRHYGFEVHCVETGTAATEAMDVEDYDLLLADINMPGNRQLELVRARANAVGGARLPPIILITAEPSVGTAIEAVRSSVIDYIVKPFYPDDLVVRVRRAIDKGRAMRRVHAAHQSVEQLQSVLGAIRASLDTPGAVPIAGLNVASSAPVKSTTAGLASLTDDERASLSDREKEVLDRLVRGDGTTDVAKALFISPHTVRNHLKAVYRKLGVSSRPELMRRLLSPRA
jgi:DNA-binding NarL/FixJ family response regulator